MSISSRSIVFLRRSVRRGRRKQVSPCALQTGRRCSSPPAEQFSFEIAPQQTIHENTGRDGQKARSSIAEVANKVRGVPAKANAPQTLLRINAPASVRGRAVSATLPPPAGWPLRMATDLLMRQGFTAGFATPPQPMPGGNHWPTLEGSRGWLNVFRGDPAVPVARLWRGTP